MKLRFKILAIAFVLLALFAGAVGTSAVVQKRIRDEMAGIIEYHLPITAAVADFDVGTFEFELQLRRLAMRRAEAGPGEIKDGGERIAALNARLRQDLARAHDLIEAAVNDARNNLGDRLILSRIQGKLDDMRRQLEPFVALGDRGADLLRAGNIAEAGEVLQGFRGFAGTFGEHLAALRDELTAFTRKSMEEASEHERLSLMITVVLFALAAAIGLAVSVFIASHIIAALRRLIAGTEAVEQGKLDTALPVAVDDEIGQLTRAFNRMIEELRAKERIKDTFGRFVDPRVVAQLVDRSADNPDAAERRVATVFFSDLKGFSGISEQLTPAALVTLLNRYFTLASAMIREHHGIVDKYIGDGVMAFWTTPFSASTTQQAVDACRAALAQLDAVDALRRELPELLGLRRNLPEIAVRIGLATGDVIIGTVGSAIAKSYTVIGDTVNLASRLEGVNKLYGTRIIVGEHTSDLVKDEFELRELDKVVAAGKTEAIRIFELMGPKGCLNERLCALRETFDAALGAYRARDWERAAELFGKCEAIDAEDTPSRIFSERVKLLSRKPIEGAWDGAWRIETK
ncbi:MAG: HAMP domain-containing protein [Alphaproteobacteria bacterium]|nr:HAMP domain-containing protein [Alphaproteobacteria bacterium]